MLDFLLTEMGEDAPVVGRAQVGGYVVSTVDTSDEGLETAILDANDAYPVQRYKSMKAALLGHEKWCKRVPTLKTIMTLQFGEIILKPGYTDNP